MLWSSEEPAIISGTVLPVYIRSNIDRVWVVGVPNDTRKIEIPLSQLEFVGSKKKAEARAREFAEYAKVYAENMQDGLPIRDGPDNGSRRVYRLRLGEIIKVMNVVEGNPPISTTGDPLPGDWYLVLTNDGVRGYCFSYRLRFFDHLEGTVLEAPVLRDIMPDPELEMVLSRTWSPEYYQQMINSRRINIPELEKNYRFDPGVDSGVARIYLPDMEMEFRYDAIYPDGDQAWRFEGTSLQMNLRTSTSLAVQFLDAAGLRRTLLFVSLSTDVYDLIIQETALRETQYMSVYNQGPVFTSSNYGTITLSEDGGFTWTGYDLLVPHIIPYESRGRGDVLMNLFISQSYTDRYTGAFTFRFIDVIPNSDIYFMYMVDNQGLRLEVVPEYGIEGITVTRRSSSPTVLYFYRDFSLFTGP